MATQDPIDRIAGLIAHAELRFQVEFLAALKAIDRSISLDDLADLIAQNRFTEAFEIVGTAAGRLGLTYAEQFVRAAQSTADFLTAEVGEITIGFDQTNTRAVQVMQNNQLRLVSSFTEQQRRATQQALVDGIRSGANPRDIARAFKNSIGLTPTQEGWVRNYERQLRSLDAGALRRELRDARFDSSVRGAIARGEPLTDRQINKMVERYRKRAIKLRAETIARTEALRSVHQGVDEMYMQAIESGQLRADQLQREWNTAGDELVRNFTTSPTSHVTMHGQLRLIGEAFTSGAGNFALLPGTFGVAIDDINCRCLVTTRILNLNEIPGLVTAIVLG